MQSRIITNEVINNFKVYLYEEERSANTISKYLHDIKLLHKYVGEKELKKSDIFNYKQKICESYSPRSVNSMLSSLNAFFEFMKWYELKVKTIKIQRQVFADKSKELTKREYEQLLVTAKAKKDKRLYYLMQTMASTGLRVSEIKHITCEAVKKGQATISCKGKIRLVFLPGKLCKMLNRYIKMNHIKSGPIFVSNRGSVLGRSYIWKILKNLCRYAGVSEKKVFPHNFRHLFARTYYSIHKDIVRLADILGHSNVNTTRIYTLEAV